MGLSEILGQDRAVGILRKLWANVAGGPSFLLFIGARGVGRKRAATLWTQALMCERPQTEEGSCGECPHCLQIFKGSHPDCVVIDLSYQEKIKKSGSSNQLGIDTVRETVSLFKKFPLSGRYCVIVIDGAEDLTLPAQISLLKILEESPPHLKWIWIVLSENRLLPTIVSRANLKVHFSPLEEKDVFLILTQKLAVKPEWAGIIAQKSGGSMERAQNLLKNKAVGAPVSLTDSSLTPQGIYQLSQRIARYRSAARAREEVGDFLEEAQTDALALWRRTPDPRYFSELVLYLRAQSELKANVTASLILERLLLEAAGFQNV